MVNWAILSEGRDGSSNGSYAFDGIDDYIESSITTTNGDKTMSVWCKSDENMATNIRQICGNGQATNSRLYLAFYNGDLVSALGEGGLDQSAPLLNTEDQWHHFVVVSNGTNGKSYQNDVLVNDFSWSGSNDISGGIIHVEKSGFGSSINFFKGKIDEFRLYDRTLTQDEIVTLNELGSQ